MKSKALVLALLAGLAGAPAFAQAPAASMPPATTRSAPATTSPTAPAPATRAPLLDINSASKDELDKLPGIGPVRADAIIKGRPYRGKDELLSKKIIPSNVYDGVKDRIIARQS